MVEERLATRMVLERLRTLSPPLRYLAYVAGVLLVLLASVGVGASASVVIGSRSEGAISGSGSSVAKGAGEGTLSTKIGEAATAFTHRPGCEQARRLHLHQRPRHRQRPRRRRARRAERGSG